MLRSEKPILEFSLYKEKWLRLHLLNLFELTVSCFFKYSKRKWWNLVDKQASTSKCEYTFLRSYDAVLMFSWKLYAHARPASLIILSNSMKCFSIKTEHVDDMWLCINTDSCRHVPSSPACKIPVSIQWNRREWVVMIVSSHLDHAHGTDEQILTVLQLCKVRLWSIMQRWRFSFLRHLQQ